MIFIIMINNRYRCYNDSKIRYQLEDISQCLIDAFILRQMDKPLKHSLRTGIGNDISDLFTFTFSLDRILTSSRNCSPFRAAYLERNRDFFIFFIFRRVFVHETKNGFSIHRQKGGRPTTNRRGKRSSLIITRRTNFQSLDQSLVVSSFSI